MISPETALSGDPGWHGAYLRMVAAIRGQVPGEPDPGPVVDGAVMSPMESYARAVSETSSPGVSLGLTLPVALTVASVAGQGAYWLKVPEQGHPLLVPGILQCTVIAPSGYGKSSVLEPLVEMLDGLSREGQPHRNMLVAQRYEVAAETVANTPGADLDRVRKIHDRGRCFALTLDSGTPEGVRGALLKGGSVAGILTAEPDILREIAGYSQDGGTFRWLLDGWSGGKVAIARAEKSMLVPRAVLPYCIVVQPVAFAQFSAADPRKDTAGIAADSAIGRGLYGRSWLVRIEDWGGNGSAYGLSGPLPGQGAVGGVGALNGVLGALAGLEGALGAVLERSDAYRVAMGITMGWEEAAGLGDTGGLNSPGLPGRIWLELSEQAFSEFVMVQNIRLGLMDLVRGMCAASPGIDTVFMPMVSRITQHVLRLALVLQLSVFPEATVVHGWAVRDAGQRLVPWLLEHWAQEMTRYARRATQELLEQEFRNNTRGEDLTGRGQVVRAIRAVTEDLASPDAEFPRDWVMKRATNAVRGHAREALLAVLKDGFEELVDGGELEKIVYPPGGKGGRPKVRYRRTPDGMAHGL